MPFPKLRGGGLLNRVQDNIGARDTSGMVTFSGILLEDIDVSATESTHITRLGKKWTGAFIVKSSVIVNIFLGGTNDGEHIGITADATATISVMVF